MNKREIEVDVEGAIRTLPYKSKRAEAIKNVEPDIWWIVFETDYSREEIIRFLKETDLYEVRDNDNRQSIFDDDDHFTGGKLVERAEHEDSRGIFIRYPVTKMCEVCESEIPPRQAVYKTKKGNVCRNCKNKEEMIRGLKDEQEEKPQKSAVTGDWI